MTLTETSPELAAEPSVAPLPSAEPDGLAAYLGTGDHKKLGRLFIVLSLLYLLAGAIGGAVLSVEQIDQGGFDVLDADSYFQGLTFGGIGLVFLGLLPLLLGLAVYVVPLQVGSRSIAFPRAAAASFWGYVLGGSLFIGSYAINGGPGGGEAQAVDLWILAFGMIALSLMLGALCVVTTAITLRTPGMYLDRVPLFSWSMVVAGVLWLLTFPVLLAALLVGYLDHRYGRLGLGGNYDLYPWYHWALRQPQVFLYAIPALGIIAEVIPVMAGTRQRFHKTIMSLIGIAGALAFGAYAVGLWADLVTAVPTLSVSTSDWPIYSNWVFVAAALVLPLPILLLLGGWVDTFVRGTERSFGAPLVFSLASGVLLLLGTSAAAAAVIEPLDLLPTSWSVGVAALATGAALLAGLGGLQYWGIKIWGRGVAPGAGLLAALLVTGGVVLVAGGQMVAGIYDQPDLVTVAANGATESFQGVLEVRDAVDTANLVSTAGWAVLAGGLVIFGLGLIGALVKARDEDVPDDPWGGHTLEWATTSPPPPANFTEVALVTSAAPLLDGRPANDGGDD